MSTAMTVAALSMAAEQRRRMKQRVAGLSKKKQWRRGNDISDIEQFFEDRALAARTGLGLPSERPDNALYQLDRGPRASEAMAIPQEQEQCQRRHRQRRPQDGHQEPSAQQPPQPALQLQQQQQHGGHPERLPTDPAAVAAHRNADGSIGASSARPRRRPHPVMLRNEAVLRASDAIQPLISRPAGSVANAAKRRMQRLLATCRPSRAATTAAATATAVPAADPIRDPQRSDRSQIARDIWADEEPANEVTDLLRTRPRMPPSTLRLPPAAQFPVMKIAAVETPLPGASYNPLYEDHQAALKAAEEARILRKRQKGSALRIAASVLSGSTDATTMHADVPYSQHARIISLDSVLSTSTVSSSKAAGDRDDAGNASGKSATVQSKQHELWSAKKPQSRRNREKRHAKTMIAAAQRKAQRLQWYELDQLRVIKKTMDATQAEQAVRRQRAAVHKQHRVPSILRNVFIAEPPITKRISELRGSLRELRPEGNLARDRLRSLQKRGLVEPPKSRPMCVVHAQAYWPTCRALTPLPQCSVPVRPRHKFVERHSYKAYDREIASAK